MIHRAGKLGLGSAVLEGFAIAQTDVVGVMDGDLSHPPELLPRLFRTIEEGNFDLAVGSRYVPGGGTANFPIGRWLLSRAGCWLARPLTPVRDAMSGFFLIRRRHLDGFQTSVKGFKIGLELFVRSQPTRLAEVGYMFVGRSIGESKMSVGEGDRLPAAVDQPVSRCVRGAGEATRVRDGSRASGTRRVGVAIRRVASAPRP